MSLALGAIVLLSVGFVVVFVPSAYIDRIQGKWVRFGAMTAIFIAYSLKTYWRVRNSLGFWCIFAGFLALHVLGVGHLWLIYNGLSTIEVGIIGGAEWGCMALLIYWVLGIRPDVRRQHPKSRWIPTL
jgi:hypothetical protein